MSLDIEPKDFPTSVYDSNHVSDMDILKMTLSKLELPSGRGDHTERGCLMDRVLKLEQIMSSTGEQY
jgi:hypothetical protein